MLGTDTYIIGNLIHFSSLYYLHHLLIVRLKHGQKQKLALWGCKTKISLNVDELRLNNKNSAENW